MIRQALLLRRRTITYSSSTSSSTTTGASGSASGSSRGAATTNANRHYMICPRTTTTTTTSSPTITRNYSSCSSSIISSGSSSSILIPPLCQQLQHNNNNNQLINLPIHRYQHQYHHQHHHTQRRWKSVFVSRHNHSLHVQRQTIIDYLSSRGMYDVQNTCRTTTTHVILKECPFCTKPTNGKADNLYKLYVQIGSGAYFCHRCGSGGSWFDFKAKLGGAPTATATSAASLAPPGYGSGGGGSNGYGQQQQAYYNEEGHYQHQHQQRYNRNSNNVASYVPPSGSLSSSSVVPCLPMPPRRLQAIYSTDLFTPSTSNAAAGSNNENEEDDPNNNNNNTMNPVLDYLVNERGLAPKTLRKYGVGKGRYAFPSNDGSNGRPRYVKTDCVTFSWIMSVSDIEYQESLRGAEFVYEIENDEKKIDPDSSSAAPLPTADACTEAGTEDANAEESISDAATTTDDSADAAQPTADTPPPSNPKDDVYITRRIKARALHEKSQQRLDPPGGAWGLFGYHCIPKGCTEVVITEGEYDAMSVWQSTGRASISLPNGCRSLPVEVLPMLENFDKIYLWMDNDGPGQEGAELFARKIGLERCYLVRPTLANTGLTNQNDLPKDANDALRMNIDLETIIQDAKLTPHERILSFEDLRDDVIHEILNPDQYSGVPLPSLPKFTSIIKGLRRGELTVLTGPTGSGKTTFLGQMSLDLAEQEVNVLWGSFEIKNTRLMHKLLQQFAREPLEAQEDHLHAIADRFSHLPMHFLKFHGGSDVDDVLDAMEYAVYVNDVQHIILDNMQFMISRQNNSGKGGGNSKWDKFDVQDTAIEKFRKFTTEKNVGVTLVVHPRKEQEQRGLLNISSVYGSAKATQEADTVIILQHDSNSDRKFVDVKKNRFNGTLGHSALHFDRSSGRYTEEPLINGKRLMPKLHVPKSTMAATQTVVEDEHDEGLLDPNTVRGLL